MKKNLTMTYTKTFHTTLEGPDTDYGISKRETAKVTIEQSWEWCDEQIADVKQTLAEYYDVKPSGILTDEEMVQEEEALRKYIDEELATQKTTGKEEGKL